MGWDADTESEFEAFEPTATPQRQRATALLASGVNSVLQAQIERWLEADTESQFALRLQRRSRQQLTAQLGQLEQLVSRSLQESAQYVDAGPPF